jgi:hypothetical protein
VAIEALKIDHSAHLDSLSKIFLYILDKMERKYDKKLNSCEKSQVSTINNYFPEILPCF